MQFQNGGRNFELSICTSGPLKCSTARILGKNGVFIFLNGAL